MLCFLSHNCEGEEAYDASFQHDANPALLQQLILNRAESMEHGKIVQNVHILKLDMFYLSYPTSFSFDDLRSSGNGPERLRHAR
eukprot:5295884-Amphidinium_carterae.1